MRDAAVARPLRPPRRTAPGVQLPLPQSPPGMPRPSAPRSTPSSTCLPAGTPATWVLSNHDVVRHRTRLGSLERARAATLLMLALPGVCYLYTGEELGLAEVDVSDRGDPGSRSGSARTARTLPGMAPGSRCPGPATVPPYGFSPPGVVDLVAAAGRTGAPLTVAAQAGRGPAAPSSCTGRRWRLRRPSPRLAGVDFRWLPSAAGVLRFERARRWPPPRVLGQFLGVTGAATRRRGAARELVGRERRRTYHRIAGSGCGRS